MDNEKRAARSVHWAKRRYKLVNLIGGVLLIAAGALTVLLFFRETPALQGWYDAYRVRVAQVEDYVLKLPGVWLIILTVLFLYVLKSLLPLPIPMMCVITGAIWPDMPYLSFALNITGLVILFTIKFFWGRHLGGGQVKRLLGLNRDMRTFLERDSGSKPWLLFVFRLVPNFPLNPVSQIFGAMGFDYADFLLISLLGFMPKLISYTILGRNVYRPLSVPFLIPLIIIFTLSGVSTIAINLAVNKKQKEG